MNREELIQVIQGAVKELEAYQKQIGAVVDILKRSSMSDVTFSAIDECSRTVSLVENCNIKPIVVSVRKALVARAKQRLKGGAF